MQMCISVPDFVTSTPEFVVLGVFFCLYVAMSGFVCIFASHFEREGRDLVGFVKPQWLECQDGTPNVFQSGGSGCVPGSLFFMCSALPIMNKNPTSSALCGAIKTHGQ